MSREVKVYIEFTLHEEGNRKLIHTLEIVMNIDLPRVDEFVYVFADTMAVVKSVRHRDEHWPEVRLEGMDFGRQPDKDTYYKDQKLEENTFYETMRTFTYHGWTAL